MKFFNSKCDSLKSNTLNFILAAVSNVVAKYKLIMLGIFLITFSFDSEGQNITVIESQSYNAGHIMDSVWKTVANNMGMNATIVNQATLYDTALLTNTDALIISSGVIILTGSQITSITQFIKSGRSLYLQGEYDCSFYNTNSTFESLINNNGGDFTLNGTVAGTLAPMYVLGTLGTTPNSVSSLNYFWYGCRANACSQVEPFLKYNGDYFGFIFCPPTTEYGRAVYTTDQDWINQSISTPLMENILTLITTNSYQCSGSNYLGAYLGVDTAICEDSTYVLYGGNSAFTYLWSTGSTDTSISVSAPGTYWVTVSNGSCIATDTVIISQISCGNAAASFDVSDTVLCEKFCVNFFDSSTNNPIAWQWIFEGASPSTSSLQNPSNICYQDPGEYDVTLITTDANGNSDTFKLNNYISVYSNPFAPVITQTGNTLTSSAASTYQWQLNGNDIPGATDQSYEITQAGLYTVIITNENGCASQSSYKAILSGIEELGIEIGFAVYPNPSNGIITVELLNGQMFGDATFEIVNTLGQIIYSSHENVALHFKKEIKLSNISNGIYFLQIKSKTNSFQQKVIVAK